MSALICSTLFHSMVLGVGDVHTQKVLHLDIKLENFLISGDPTTEVEF